MTTQSARPVVALVGRPNVGKSTLFNRLCGTRKAIVEDMPGVTRDRNYAEITIADRPVLLVDTGGFEPKTNDDMLVAMRRQTELAIEEADVVVLVMDGNVGVRPEDGEIARRLRKAQKVIIAAVNKIDHQGRLHYEFHKLGIEPTLAVSAEHGLGTAELCAAIAKVLPESTAPAAETEVVCRVAVLGRPNVGKSSLVNRLLGEDRHLATPIAGTTRDSIDSFITRNNDTFCLIDTAGVRRKARVSEQLEEYMVMSALRSLERADVVVLVLDATELATDQDAKIAALCHDRGKGLIIAINKWDLPHDGIDAKNVREELEYKFPFLNYARSFYMSAKTGQGVERLFDEIRDVLKERERRVTTGELNRFLQMMIDSHPPPMLRGRRAKIYYGAQVSTSPPTFVIQVNDPRRVPASYERYIINSIRKEYGFSGVPVFLRLKMRAGKDLEDDQAT